MSLSAELMKHGVCIFEGGNYDEKKYVVKKFPTPTNYEQYLIPLDPDKCLANGDPTSAALEIDRTQLEFETEDAAYTFAKEYIGYKEPEVEVPAMPMAPTMTCSVSLAYRVKNFGELKIVILEPIQASSPELAQETAEEMAKSWFKNHPDIWDSIKVADGKPKPYEIKVRPA